MTAPDDVFPPGPEITRALDLLASGRAGEAVPLLERGTGFLLQERLERRLFHLDDLRLLGFGKVLDAYLSRADMLQSYGSGLVSGVEGVLGELNEIAEQIRTIEGYAEFLVPPDLRRLAGLGFPDPVAYVVAGEETGWAVITYPGGAERPIEVRLPELTRAATQQRALAAWFNSASEPEFEVAVRALDEVAAWSWDSCMGQICSVTEESSRITIVPVGPVALLPLQVAFTPDTDAGCGRRYALDHLVISFAPNQRIAAFTRRQPGRAESSAALVMAPNPSDEGRTVEDLYALPCSGPEARYVSGLYGATAPPHLGAAATPDVFLQGLRGSGVIHFAGHARSSPTVSGAHFLRFADEQLMTLNDLTAARDGTAELVVLSACTSTLGTVSHPEQALTIANVLLAAGVRDVVATTWRVIDDATAILACRFHKLAKASPTQIPEALRAAQRWFRDATPTELREAADEMEIELKSKPEWLSTPVAWGGFVHCGSGGTRGLLEPRSSPRPRAFGYDAREVADYYSFPSGRDGSGVSIGIVDVIGDYEESDIETYFQATGRTAPSIERVLAGRLGDGRPRPTPEYRASLTAFLQILGSVAPAARLTAYLAENSEAGIHEGLSRAIFDEERENAIVCLTAGVSERRAPPGMADVLGDLAMSAATMGTVVCVAAWMLTEGGPGDDLFADLPAGCPYVLACSATEGAATDGRFFERPRSSFILGSPAYERPEWQEEAIIEPLSMPEGSIVPDVCALGGPFPCVVDGQWMQLDDELLAVAFWAGMLARINEAVGQPWGLVPNLYTVFAPAGGLAPVPRSTAPGRPGWRAGVGLGAPDGDAFLAVLRTAQAGTIGPP